MPFSGGTFSRTFDCTTDRDNGVKILASKFDTELDGFATGLSTCILKDGTQTCTAAIPFAEGLTVPDNKTIILGTNSDITIQYDESTNDSLEIAANVEGAALGIVLKADQGDDNADQHKLNIADGGVLTLGSKISGGFVSYLTHTPNATVADSTTAVAGNLTVGGDLTLGSGAVINEAELEAIDGVTAGTVAASKAVIVDSNKDIASFRNVTLTGELDAGSLDISGDADIDGTLEADAMTLNGTAITATATLDTGISNNNVPKFTSGVADNDFLRVAGTAIEGRSASEVLSDIGGQASLTFGISHTNAVKIDSSSVADDEYARFTANGLESRATSEVLSDIGAAPAAGSSNIVTTGALNSGSITSGFGSIDNGSSAITTTGVISGGTLEATADTSAGDNAAIGFTSAEGLILTGQGSTSDITLKNDADAVVFSVPTGTDDILFPDGAKVIFGAGSDFSINHDASDGNLLTLAANPLEIHQAGTNSALQIYRDTGDGTLLQFFAGGSGLTERGSILTDTNLLTLNANKDFKIKVNNGEIAADFLADGAVNLYHDTGLRLSTTSGGVDIAGGFTATDGCTITTADNDAQLSLVSTDADANFGPVLKMHRNSGSPADSDFLGEIQFKGENDAGEEILYAQMFGRTGDVTDGTEDGRIATKIMIAGTAQNVLDIKSDEIVINDDSADIDFRVESDNDANAFFVQGSSGNVGIGTNSPAGIHSQAEVLEISGGDGGDLVIGNNSSTNIGAGAHIGAIAFKNIDGSTGSVPHYAGIRCESADTSGNMDLRFYTGIGNLEADTPQAIMDKDGNVLVGKTSIGVTTVGVEARGSGILAATRSGGEPLTLNRTTSDGTIVDLKKDGTSVGSIGVDNNGDGVIDGGSNHAGIRFVSDALSPRQNGSESDNVVDLGKSDARFDDVFATNGTIQTSDQNEKQDIASLTTAEITAAKAISKLFKTFKWQDKVAAKGDAARTHTGVIAQEVQTAMTDAGLDASKYAFWCSDTWWETSTEVAAVEADEEAGIEAKDAYTRIDTYQTADEAPEGATKRTRLGVRYPELLAFVGAATEQRLADIETRLTALEAGS